MEREITEAYFTISDNPIAFKGYHIKGFKWNGWAIPYFELDAAEAVAEYFNKQSEPMGPYPFKWDGLKLYRLDDDNQWVAEGPYAIAGKELYNPGGMAWVWEEIKMK